MSTTIKYKNNIIGTADKNTVTLATGGTWVEGDIVVTDNGPTINPLTVTENGTFTAPSGVDGYSPITVNVSGSGDDLLYKMLSNTLTSYSNDTLTSLPQYAFRGCTNLESVSFANVDNLKPYVFQFTGDYNSGKLASVNMPKLATLGNFAFYGIPTLTSLTFPKFRYANTSAFRGLTNLALIDLGAENTNTDQCYFGQSVFQDCYKLQTLVLRKTNIIYSLQSINAFTNTPFRGYNSLSGVIYVPSALKATYEAATNWATLVSGGYCTFESIEGSIYE